MGACDLFTADQPEIRLQYGTSPRPKIPQKIAWHLARLLRLPFAEEGGVFSGPVEVDESNFGGRRGNMSNAGRKALTETGRRSVGKIAVVGAKDRAAKKLPPGRRFRRENHPPELRFPAQPPGATIDRDAASAYEAIPFDRQTIKTPLSEYVRGNIHANGIESLWSMLERTQKGTFHKLSPKHLDRHVQELAARHNLRERDTIDIMGSIRYQNAR